MTFVPLVKPPADVGDAGHWFVVRTSEVLVSGTDGSPLHGEAPWTEEDPVFLGLLDNMPCWAVGVPAGTEAEGDARWEHLHVLGARVPEPTWALAGRAVQLVEWSRTHRYCGRCGTRTEPSEGERALRCPACGLLAFPRLAPAIIVLVERGEEALLANGRAFGVPMYSTLAGFVEPGETLEEAVRREVKEEVGIEVGDVRYFSSQPWPFPHSLMIGFHADWAAGEIDIDPTEIVDAGWYRAGAFPQIPPGISIARRLIDDWLRRRNAG